MLATVKLNVQHRISTDTIDDKAIDRHLPFEFPAREPASAQTEPEDSLCVRHLPTQSSRGWGVVGHLLTSYAVPTPLTPPLSPAGRGSRSCSLRSLSSTSLRGLSPNRWHTA